MTPGEECSGPARGLPACCIEILEDYRALDDEALEVAPRYAVLYPPRGRPKHAPWRNRKPTHVFAAGERGW